MTLFLAPMAHKPLGSRPRALLLLLVNEIMDAARFLKEAKHFEFSTEVGDTVCFVDSSFNPPNRAHLKLARFCREVYPDSHVFFLMATGNADKPSVPVEQLQTRITMIDTMIKSEFRQDPKVGIALTTEARFLDKARQFHAQFPTTKQVFAVGYDTLLRLIDQKYYDTPVSQVVADLFSMAEIAVLTRNEDDASTSHLAPAEQQQNQIRENPVLNRYVDKIHVLVSSADTDNVSSSRARLSREEARRCCPPAVADFIAQNHLYNQ